MTAQHSALETPEVLTVVALNCLHGKLFSAYVSVTRGTASKPDMQVSQP